MRENFKNKPVHAGCWHNTTTRGAFLLMAVAVLFLAGPGSRGQQNGLSHAGNFTSVEYFEAPNQRQMRTRLTGAEASPLAGGLLVIKQLKLETFESAGKTELIVDAPECIYDAMKGTANSTGRLQAQTGDGKIHVEGDGFLWQQSQSLLTISNNVRTIIAGMALVAAGALNASAQTNLDAATNSAPGALTRIDSDHANFDMNARRAVYQGHVVVADPQMKLTCAELTADLPPSGGRMNHIVAETNVVIDFMDEKGQTMHATSDKAVYHYNVENSITNETVTLTGSPQIVNAQGIQAGDEIIWHRADNRIEFVNPHMIFRQSLSSAPAETNSTVAKTNFPPGTIQNIDKISQPNKLF